MKFDVTGRTTDINDKEAYTLLVHLYYIESLVVTVSINKLAVDYAILKYSDLSLSFSLALCVCVCMYVCMCLYMFLIKSYDKKIYIQHDT